MVPIYIFIASSLIAFCVVVGLVLTKGLHGRYSLDSSGGIQKLHTAPTPRIGGLAIVIGIWGSGYFLPDTMRELWIYLSIALVPAFVAGLIEDITKKVGVGARLLATICSGLIFCIISETRIDQLDIPGVDWLLSFEIFAVFFTAFAIGGVANAINIIDGVNGLASGTVIILLSGFSLLAWQVDDIELMLFSLLAMGAIFGFFLLNFPLGHIFLGDAGAYTSGFLLAAISVALPARNPEISPLIGLLALSYPVLETLISIHRRVVREGTNPGQPDRLHLHSLVYRSKAKRLAQLLNVPHLRNPITSVILWSLPLLSVMLMVLVHDSNLGIAASLIVIAVLYQVLYRRVALLRKPRGQRPSSVVSN